MATTQDHELDADEVLAEHFGFRVEKYREIVDVWEHNYGVQYPHLSDFIAMLRERQAKKDGQVQAEREES